MSYKENAGLEVTAIRRWLGISHGAGGLMSYWVLMQTGTVMSRIRMVERITNIERSLTKSK